MQRRQQLKRLLLDSNCRLPEPNHKTRISGVVYSTGESVYSINANLTDKPRPREAAVEVNSTLDFRCVSCQHPNQACKAVDSYTPFASAWYAADDIHGLASLVGMLARAAAKVKCAVDFHRRLAGPGLVREVCLDVVDGHTMANIVPIF